MRVIPVMDLKDGTAVHAVRGERARYRPVTGALVSDGDPLALARAFREQLGLQEFYVADLDAIQGRDAQRAILADLARLPGQRMMLDAGAADAAQARQILALGAHKVIIGSETLASLDELAAIFASLPPDRLVFSLDLRSSQVLASDARLAALSPLDLLQQACDLGCREAILLDLARVGAAAGADRALIAAAHARFPRLHLLAGGGIRHVADLQDLQAAGAAGALVATALHNGTIGPAELAALNSGS